MKFSPYKRYKNSGVEWLGEIPEQWETIRFRFLLKDGYDGLKIGPFGSQIKLDDLSNEGYKIYGQENVINRDFTIGDRYVDEDKFRELSVYELQPGDLTITMMGTSGKCEIVPENIEKGIMDSHLIRLRVTDRILQKFARCLIDQSAYVAFQILLMGKGSIMHGLNSSIIKNLYFAVPPIEEQETIISFLENKTDQIDRLIEKKQALIEKLNQKRTTMIIRAVTKGLDETAPMKDSGVEWLGEVPEHWEVKKTKYLTQILRGKFSHRPRNDPDFYDGDYPFIQTGDVSNSRKYIEQYSQTLNEKGYSVSKQFPAGTLVMTIAANIGDMAILNFDACFPDSIVGVVPEKDIDLDYLFYLFVAMKAELMSTAVLNTQLNLNIMRIASMSTVCPLLKEQVQIAAFLEETISDIENFSDKISDAIGQLQEYRTALITAAVTGKIDVRNFKPHRKDNPAREAA